MTAHPHPTPGTPALTHRPTRPRSHAARLSGQTISPPDPSPGQVHHPTRRSPPRSPFRHRTETSPPLGHPGPDHHADVSPAMPRRPLTPARPPQRVPQTPISPHVFSPPKTAQKRDRLSQTLKNRGKIRPKKPLQKFVTPYTYVSSLESACHPPLLQDPVFRRLHKFVTPLRYKIPPFSLAQPRAKICDTPQIRNTPIFPGTALGRERVHISNAPKRPKLARNQPGRAKPAQKSAMQTAQKFVTPLRYEIPPFSLAQPRAKICDTPQLRNTPIFLGTAPRKNLIQL